MRALTILALCALVVAAAALAQVGPAVSVAQTVPAQVSGVGLVSWSQTCGAAAAPLVPASDSRVFTSIRCWVEGTTAVYFGSTSVTTAIGFEVCEGGTCMQHHEGIWEAHVRRGGAGCITGGGNVTVRCQGPAPQ